MFLKEPLSRVKEGRLRVIKSKGIARSPTREPGIYANPYSHNPQYFPILQIEGIHRQKQSLSDSWKRNIDTARDIVHLCVNGKKRHCYVATSSNACVGLFVFKRGVVPWCRIFRCFLNSMVEHHRIRSKLWKSRRWKFYNKISFLFSS